MQRRVDPGRVRDQTNNDQSSDNMQSGQKAQMHSVRKEVHEVAPTGRSITANICSTCREIEREISRAHEHRLRKSRHEFASQDTQHVI